MAGTEGATRSCFLGGANCDVIKEGGQGGVMCVCGCARVPVRDTEVHVLLVIHTSEACVPHKRGEADPLEPRTRQVSVAHGSNKHLKHVKSRYPPDWESFYVFFI